MAFQVSPGVQVKEVDLTNVVPAVSSTVGGSVVNLSSATGTMNAAGSKTTILEISGQDFTLGGSGLANLNLANTRNQPKQRSYTYEV